MKRGRKKGSVLINGKVMKMDFSKHFRHKKLSKAQFKKLEKERLAIKQFQNQTPEQVLEGFVKEIQQKERAKVIDHVRNVILPYLERNY